MSATLEILLRGDCDFEETFEFFKESEWNQDTERTLFHELHEIIRRLRPEADHLSIICQVRVSQPDQAVCKIRKYLKTPVEICTCELSQREAEILGLIMQGLTNGEIAEKLFISTETVKSHRSHILSKTGARNTAALITYYHQTFFDK